MFFYDGIADPWFVNNLKHFRLLIFGTVGQSNGKLSLFSYLFIFFFEFLIKCSLNMNTKIFKNYYRRINI